MTWNITAEKTVYNAGPVLLKELSVTDPNGNNTTRVQLSLQGDSVLVIPQLQSGRVVLCKQHRIGFQEPVLEFPNGGIEEDETPEQAAHRELKEETGYSGRMRKAGVFAPLAGLVDLNVHVFVCECQDRQETSPDDYEDIEVIDAEYEELQRMVKEEAVADGYLLAALGLIEADQDNPGL